MIKGTTTKTTISSVLFLVGLVSFGFMAYQIDKNGRNLANQVENLEKSRQQEDSYIKLRKLVEETEEDRKLLDSLFIRENVDDIDFLNSIESIATKRGIVLEIGEDLNFIEDKESKEKWMVGSYSFSGSKEEVSNFIQILETLPYVLRVDSVEMKAMSSTDWTAKVNMRIKTLDYAK